MRRECCTASGVQAVFISRGARRSASSVDEAARGAGLQRRGSISSMREAAVLRFSRHCARAAADASSVVSPARSLPPERRPPPRALPYEEP